METTCSATNYRPTCATTPQCLDMSEWITACCTIVYELLCNKSTTNRTVGVWTLSCSIQLLISVISGVTTILCWYFIWLLTFLHKLYFHVPTCNNMTLLKMTQKSEFESYSDFFATQPFIAPLLLRNIKHWNKICCNCRNCFVVLTPRRSSLGQLCALFPPGEWNWNSAREIVPHISIAGLLKVRSCTVYSKSSFLSTSLLSDVPFHTDMRSYTTLYFKHLKKILFGRYSEWMKDFNMTSTRHL